MGKCHTEPGKTWESKINGHLEDHLLIDEKPGGDFEVTFQSSQKKFKGKCREKHNEPHRIHFTTDDHLYVGVFVGDDKFHGFKFKLDDVCGDDDDAHPLNGDEDWVGTKVSTA